MLERVITTHRRLNEAAEGDGTELNQKLSVVALGEPDPDGAHHLYEIRYPDVEILVDAEDGLPIAFQKGGVKEVGGVNGISNEALLAVVLDRLEGWQRGPFACEENAAALSHLESVLAFMHGRTLDRQRRGVEGESKP